MTKAKEAIAIWRNDPLLVIRIYYDLRNGVVAKGIRDGEFLPATVCFADPQGSCGSIIGYPQIKLTVKGKACHLITLWIEEGRLNRGILLENGKRDIGPDLQQSSAKRTGPKRIVTGIRGYCHQVIHTI